MDYRLYATISNENLPVAHKAAKQLGFEVKTEEARQPGVARIHVPSQLFGSFGQLLAAEVNAKG